MTSATRLWLLWQMGPGVGRRHVREGAPSLFAEDILRLGQVEGVAGMELVRLEKAQLPLHEFIKANVENEEAQKLIAMIALAIDGAA